MLIPMPEKFDPFNSARWDAAVRKSVGFKADHADITCLRACFFVFYVQAALFKSLV
jgi:hypothetical protein